MTNPTDLVQLYILLSYEKLQRAVMSQRQRPVEASLRNRLLVWRFLKKIENEPVSQINSAQEFLLHNQQNNSNPWFFDLNQTCDVDHDEASSDQNRPSDTTDETNGLPMDIDTDLVAVLGNDDLNESTCETMNIEQTSDVNLFLKRAIGAERRQKVSSDHFHSHPKNDVYQSNLHLVSTDSTYEDTEQLFHDLCAELTNTTAALVSSTTSNVLNFSSSPEQTLIH